MRLLLAGCFLLVLNIAFCQNPCWTGSFIYSINFDDGQCMEGLFIDTISNQNNIWQIGTPQKNLFTSAYSIPNAIVTDTANYYPPNNTSSFIISHIAGAGFSSNHTASIEGYYKVNSDSLNDFGSIELSPDNGVNWIDIINDNSVLNAWNSPVPILTGNSNGWQYFGFNTLEVAGNLGISAGDTLKYRFSFASDSNLDTLDGLMFDDFKFQDLVEGIDEIGMNKINSKIFPNPGTNSVSIEFDNPLKRTFEFKLINSLGELVLMLSDLKENSVIIDVSNLDDGMYIYQLYCPEMNTFAYGKSTIHN